MAFTVTPTSGAQPYTFLANISNKIWFNHGYTLVFSNASANNTCPAPSAEKTPDSSISGALLANSVYIENSTVPTGTCSRFWLQIFNSLGEEVEVKSVTVSNLTT